jgi:hypothetical protein
MNTSSGHSSRSTSSLLEANDIVWELVKKTFSVQQNIIVYKQRHTPDLSTCPIGKVFKCRRAIQRKNGLASSTGRLRLNKLLPIGI